MGGNGAKTSRTTNNGRYQTTLEVARTAFPSGGSAKAVYIADGTVSTDAIVTGFIDNKAELAGPVLLVETDTVPAGVEACLKAAHQTNSALKGELKALGGAMVIGNTVMGTVRGSLE